MAVNQTDILLDLSYLLGEQSVPTSGIEDRKAFIQRALERVYRLYDFKWAEDVGTVSLTNGVGSLPTTVRHNPNLDVRVIATVGANNDLVFSPIEYEDQDKYVSGDFKYWLTGSQGNYTLNTTETAYPSVTVKYPTVAPSVNASVTTPCPSSMLVARGALVYYRQSENPQADISQDESLFQRELQEYISTEQRNKPRAKAKTRQAVDNTYTGMV